MLERTTLQRHDLLRVSPAGWHAILAATPGLEQLETTARQCVQDWVSNDWPVIVRRPIVTDATTVAVGLPLPPMLGKQRLGYTLDPEHISQVLPAVSLHETAAIAPLELQRQIEAVLTLGNQLTITPTVFGSLLWQHLTGLTYLHTNSDIDLLWSVTHPASLPDLLPRLATLDAMGPARLDGEIVLPNSSAVNWRELYRVYTQPESQVLTKSLNRVELKCVGQLFE